MDSTRPINDASGDDHVLTDIWSVHNYEQDGKRLSEQLIFKEGEEPYRNSRDKNILLYMKDNLIWLMNLEV